MKRLLRDGQINECDIDKDVRKYFGEIESESSCGSDSSMSDGLPMQILHASIPEVHTLVQALFGVFLEKKTGQAQFVINVLITFLRGRVN